MQCFSPFNGLRLRNCVLIFFTGCQIFIYVSVAFSLRCNFTFYRVQYREDCCAILAFRHETRYDHVRQ